MKKIIGLLVLLAIFAVGCSTSEKSNTSSKENAESTTNTNNDKAVELSFSTWFPTSDPLVETGFKEWEEMVKEKTDGKVNIVSYHANQLGTADTMLQDLAAGVFEIAPVSPILFNDSDLFPYTISNLPFAISDAKTGTKVMSKFLEKYSTAKDIEILATGNADPYVLWSTKPIENIDDMKGMKIRAISQVHIDLVKSWGASPVAIPVADIYEAFQKGTLDGAVFSLVGGASWNYFEVAPFITNIAVSTPTFMPSMNKDAFNSLPEDLQILFKEELGPALTEIWSEHYFEYTNKFIEAHEENTKGKGKVIDLSPEEAKPLKEPSKEIWDAWVEEANEKGYPGEEMINDFKSYLLEEGVTLPFE